MPGRRLRRIPGAIADLALALLRHLIGRTPSGRTEFFEPDEFPWIADVEARAGEIKEELDGLLARVDQLPNLQDIQEEQRTLTQDNRWKIFYFYVYGTRADGSCQRCPRTAEIVESIPGMTTAVFSVLLPHKHIPLTADRGRECCAIPRAAHAPPTRPRLVSASAATSSTGVTVAAGLRRHVRARSWNDSDEIRVVLFVDVIASCRGTWRHRTARSSRPFGGHNIKRCSHADSGAWQETLGVTITGG
jgi:beta-hydroxylase